MPKISAEEFSNRLAALCLSGGGRGFPKKEADKLILYKSLFLTMEPARDYSEKDLKAVLEKWLAGVGAALEIDHVSLRRQLVDEGLLIRDPAGSAYRLNADRLAELFESAVDNLDPVAVLEEAKALKERKRQEFLNKSKG